MDIKDRIDIEIEKWEEKNRSIEEQYKKDQISFGTYITKMIEISTTINTLRYVLAIMD